MLALLDLQFRRPLPRAVSAETESSPPPPPDEPFQKRLLENRHFRPVLVASKPQHMAARRPFGGSILTHIGMGALIIMITQPVPPAPAGGGEPLLIFLPQIQPAQPEPPRILPQLGGGGGSGGMIVVANPPPRGFQTVKAPVVVPTGLPEVNLNEHAMDPRDYTGVGVEGGVSYGVAGGTGTVDATEGPVVVAGAVYAEATPDVRYTRAQLIHQVAPVYPPALRMARIEGSVVIRFVIDTLGSVEPASVEVLESTRESFDRPAIEAILATRFKAARFGTMPVRQLTNQRISFRLAGGGG